MLRFGYLPALSVTHPGVSSLDRFYRLVAGQSAPIRCDFNLFGPKANPECFAERTPEFYRFAD